MAMDVERLVVHLEARMAQYERSMAKAAKTADMSARKIESRFAAMNKRLTKMGGSLSLGLSTGRGVVGAIAGSAALHEAQQILDASTRIQNALKSTGLEGQALDNVYQTLFASAQKNAAPIEAMANLYGKLALAQSDLGVSSTELLTFTDRIGAALRAGGTSATEASGALLQLSQALGGGTVRAEEFNSMLEGAPEIIRAAAAGLDGANGSVSRLRDMVNAGQVTSRAFFDAFLKGSDSIAERASSAAMSIDDSMVMVQNALIDAGKHLDAATGASQGTADALKALAGWIVAVGDAFGQAAKSSGWQLFFSKLGEANRLIRDVMMPASGIASGVQKIPGRLKGLLTDWNDPAAGGTGSRIAPGGVGASSFDSRFNGAPLSTGTIYSPPSYASSTDGYPLTSDGTLKRLARQAAATRDLSTALRDQNDAVATLGDTFGESTFDTAGFVDAQKQATAAAQEFAGIAKDVLGGFVRDLIDGKSASEALGSALDKVIDRLLSSGIDMLLNGMLGGLGGGGLLGSLFGFAKGGIASHGRPQPLPRFAKGGVSRSAAIFGEAGPEAAVPLPDGRNIPVKMLGGGSRDVVTINLVDDSGRMADIADKRIRTASGAIVRVAVQQTRQALPDMIIDAQMRSH